MKALSPHVKIMKNIEYFEKLKRHYERRDVIEYFNDFLIFSRTNSLLILDCGSGIGYLSKTLTLCGKQVISIDINSYMLRYAKKELRLSDVICGSACNVPIRDAVVDAIFFIDVIEHLDEPLEGLKELKRVLKPEGSFFLVTPNGLYRKITSRLLMQLLGPTHVHEFTWKEICELVRKAGLRISRSRSAGIPLLNKLSFKASRRVAKYLFFLLPLSSPSFWIELRKEKKREGWFG